RGTSGRDAAPHHPGAADRRGRVPRQGRVEGLVAELLAEMRVREPPLRLALRLLEPGAERVQRPPRLGVANLAERLRQVRAPAEPAHVRLGELFRARCALELLQGLALVLVPIHLA